MKYLSNDEVLERLMEKAGAENPNQYAAYLTAKYGRTISRQNLNQIKGKETVNLIHILLREALEE
jgi:hypothetical protein